MRYVNDPKAWERLHEHYDRGAEYCEEHDLIPLFCSIIGSYNYSLNTEESDVDTRMVVIPKFRSAILSGFNVSKELSIDDSDEHCHIIEFANWVDTLEKGCITALEVLCGRYIIFNDMFAKSYFEEIQNNIYYFVHVLRRRFVDAQLGYAVSQMKRNTPKSIMHGYRSLKTIEKTDAGKSFFECIVLPEEDRTELLAIRNSNGETYNADTLAEEIRKCTEKQCQHEFPVDKNERDGYRKKLDDTIVNLYSYYWNVK